LGTGAPGGGEKNTEVVEIIHLFGFLILPDGPSLSTGTREQVLLQLLDSKALLRTTQSVHHKIKHFVRPQDHPTPEF
jgi:hypothetical protein